MMSDDDYKRVFDRTANKGIAVEINVAGFWNKSEQEILDSQPLRLFRIAKECGCKFTFGSDSHNNTAHKYFELPCNVVSDALGLTENDIHEFVR